MIVGSFEPKPLREVIIPSSAPVSSVTIPNLDGDDDEEYLIEYELYLTNSETGRVNIAINGTVTTAITTVSHWHGYWSGALTGPQTEAIGTFTLLRAEGTGWHDGKAVLKAKTGKVRELKSDYGIRDTTLGYTDRTSRAFWDDTTTKITSLTISKIGATSTFYGNIRVYRKLKT